MTRMYVNNKCEQTANLLTISVENVFGERKNGAHEKWKKHWVENEVFSEE